MNTTTLEICVDSLRSAIAAEEGGAQRIELCAAMPVGGITPSYGLIRQVCSRLRIPVHVLVRPRPGDFAYSTDDLQIMVKDVIAAKELGASAVVLGVLSPGRSIDARALARLAKAARPMSVTFHRAFDEVAGKSAAIETLVRLGVERVLTTGGPATAFEGRRSLARLVLEASGRISVMAGGGIGTWTVRRIVDESGVSEVHIGSAVSSTRSSGRGIFRVEEGVVAAGKVKSLLRIIQRRR